MSKRQPRSLLGVGIDLLSRVIVALTKLQATMLMAEARQNRLGANALVLFWRDLKRN